MALEFNSTGYDVTHDETEGLQNNTATPTLTASRRMAIQMTTTSSFRPSLFLFQPN
jgi:hypothetical protein